MRTCTHCGRLYSINGECECKPIRDKARKEKKRIYQREYAEENEEFVRPLKTARWQRFRKMIIARDNGHCQRCLIKYNIINGDNLHVHHIIARVKAPELIFEPSNTITLCATCNYDLGTGDLDFEPNRVLMEDNMEPNL